MKKTLVIVGLLVLVSTLALAVFKYEIPWQKEHLTADPSGRITLSKSFVFKVLPESTENGTEIWVGLPTENTKVQSASYLKDGRLIPLTFKQRSSGGEYQVIFDEIPPILPGESLEIHFTASIPDLIYWLNKKELDKSAGEQRVSLSYIPAWWEEAVVGDLTVEFSFGPSLELESVQYAKEEPTWIDRTPEGVAIGYRYQNVPKDTKLNHALVLPKSYFSAGFEPQKDWPSAGQITLIVGIVGAFVVFLGLLAAALTKVERYSTPAAYIQGKEAFTSFDPVETALFFNVPGDVLVKLIIMGLMDKNVIKMTSSGELKKETTLESLSWYEKLFLESVDDEVNILPDKWEEFCNKTFDQLKKMLGGYCGMQTKTYYQKKLTELYDDPKADPRWKVLKDYLDKKIPEKKQEARGYQPAYLEPYFPFFYFSFINSDMEAKRRAAFTGAFIGKSGTGHGGGSSCACACACACASSGGCT